MYRCLLCDAGKPEDCHCDPKAIALCDKRLKEQEKMYADAIQGWRVEVERLKGENRTLSQAIGKSHEDAIDFKNKAVDLSLALKEAKNALEYDGPADGAARLIARDRINNPAALLEAHDREVATKVWDEAGQLFDAHHPCAEGCRNCRLGDECRSRAVALRGKS